MERILRTIFYGAWFMPHGHCYLWQPRLVGLHVISDVLIGTAYVLISLVLYALVRRIRLPFSTMIVAFGVFIGACGLTHFIEAWNVWHSAYWLAGWVKALTALASVATCAYLVRARPTIVEVASAARLSEARRVELETKNRELEALYARVRDADRVKTEFFANVSHELRTPLALILGPVERILEREAVSAEARSDLEVVRRNGRVLLRHVNALLEAAKLEAERVHLDRAESDLVELVKLCASNFRALADERSVTLTVEGAERLPCAMDVEKVERVVLNLLSNAFKFTPSGGAVRCAVTGEGTHAQLVVEDSGPGVPVEQRELIFERFRQSDGGASRAFGGTGLGLSIARDFVRLHGGTLDVSGSPLGGARFVMRLPAEAPEGVTVRPSAEIGREALAAEAEAAVVTLRAEPLAPDPEVMGVPGRPRVLVVEDTAEMRAFIRRALAEDFEVYAASDGNEGLTRALALAPDVVVTDIMMPGMSGDVLVRRLREEPSLAATPVMLVSARADDALRVELLRGGAQDYIVKPFRAAELVARVKNLAAMKRTRDVLEGALSARDADVETLARELAQRTRQVEAALDSVSAARHEAERESEAKSTLLRLVSHELRTPLSVLQLTLHSLARGDAENRPELLARVKRAAGRLHSTVEMVLEFTRVEEGKVVANAGEVDVAAVMRDVVDELRPDAQRKLLTLDAVTPDGPVVLHTDERLVRLIFVNLVSNAIKYTDQGRVTARVTAEGGEVRVAVEDTGRGITPEDQRRLFEPFRQLEPIQHKTTPGLGLGLWLVKELAAALQSKVSVDSEPGRGSTFAVNLVPLRE